MRTHLGMMAAMTMSRVEQWERRSEVPLLLHAVALNALECLSNLRVR